MNSQSYFYNCSPEYINSIDANPGLDITKKKNNSKLYIVIVNMHNDKPNDYYIYKFDDLSDRIKQVYDEYISTPKRDGTPRKDIKITVCRRISMNKADLITTLTNETGLTKSEAEAVVNLFFNEMANTLAKGDRVEIRGLCSLYVKKYKAYAGRNPKTGRPVRVESKKLPFFKVGKELMERVDNQN